ncbi:hypothetical protein [Thiocapsa sp.]|uniref:hypothetical protein n=1 Tax=Thiocapsa sp. TaxID=2024551 RepID=UPI0025D98B60|nr:hypothetical protein [Thiocapsa sp.]
MTIPHFAMTESSFVESRSVRRESIEILVGLACTPMRRRDAIQVLSFKILEPRSAEVFDTRRTLLDPQALRLRSGAAQAGAMLTLVV